MSFQDAIVDEATLQTFRTQGVPEHTLSMLRHVNVNMSLPIQDQINRLRAELALVNSSFSLFEEMLHGEENVINFSRNETTDYSMVPICHPYETVTYITHFYYLPCMICVGLIGNLLSCIVFLHTHLKMRSSSYYLAALACVDFVFLVTLFIVWLSEELDLKVFNADGYCQVIVYVSSVCGFLSVWLIVAFTVERFIAVQYPLHRPHMCTVARAKAIVLYLTGFAIFTHVYVFITSGIIYLDDGTQVCEMLETQLETMKIINIIDSFITLIIPLVLIITMNAMIAVNLFKFSRRFKQHVHQHSQSEQMEMNIQSGPQLSRSSSNNNNNSRRQASQQSCHSSRSNNSCCQTTVPVSKKRSCDVANANPRCIQIVGFQSRSGLISTRTQYSITKMLLLISSVFLLLNLPSYVIRLYVFIFISIWSEQPPIKLWCLQQIFMTLYYTNFSVNFLLYSMCGITFRRCLWQLIRNKVKWLPCIFYRQRVKNCFRQR